MGRTKDKEINSQEVLLKAVVKSIQTLADIEEVFKQKENANFDVLFGKIDEIFDNAELILVANKEHEKYLTHKEWKKSSNIKATIYDSLLKRLTVEFKNGGVYDYERVPKKIYKKFEKAESVGKFLSKSIIPKYKTFKRK